MCCELNPSWAGLKAIQSITRYCSDTTSLPQPSVQLHCDVYPGERETGIENAEKRGEGIPF
jgi:hypothetical protein